MSFRYSSESNAPERSISWNVSGLLLTLPHGAASWRIVGHHIRKCHDRHYDKLLIMSVERPTDMAVVLLTEVEELLQSGKLRAECDMPLWICCFQSGIAMQDVVDSPMGFLEKLWRDHPALLQRGMAV